MNDYERTQYQQIEEWKAQEPSIVKKTIDFAMKPVLCVSEKIIPPKLIEGALKGANGIARTLADEKDIMRDGNVGNISELATKELQLSDKLANNVHNWAIGLAATEGGICGYLGLPGMFVDVPAIITFALRTIHKIGLCYGYKFETPEDTQFVLNIMSLAGANTMQEKNTALLTLKSLQVILKRLTWKKMAEKAAQNATSKEGFLLAIKALAKQLGINLTKRKTLQIISVIGAGVGTSMNGDFINDIAWAARRCCQERWLIENGKI